MINPIALIKELARGEHGSRDLSQADADYLYTAMLDGEVSDIQLGGILVALRMKGESDDELIGFYRACERHLAPLEQPRGHVRPVVLPSYNGARHLPNLTPLLALLLVKLGIPVLVHGVADNFGRVDTVAVLRELGVQPCDSLAQVNQRLSTDKLALVFASVLSPGLSRLLDMRAVLGVRNTAHTLAKMMSPFEGDALRLVSVSHPAYLDKMRVFFVHSGQRALVLRGTEGEPFANPKRRPELCYCADGHAQMLFEAETGSLKSLPELPATIDAVSCARWINQVLAGERPIPQPIVDQLACCVLGVGLADSLTAAVATVAMHIDHLSLV